jgi:uncharacterized protein
MAGNKTNPLFRQRRWLIGTLGMGLIVSFFLFTSYPLRAEIRLIGLYQEYASPLLASTIHCRFHPSCSQYAFIVLSREGFYKGNLYIVLRLIHCSPIGALWDYARKSFAG